MIGWYVELKVGEFFTPTYLVYKCRNHSIIGINKLYTKRLRKGMVMALLRKYSFGKILDLNKTIFEE